MNNAVYRVSYGALDSDELEYGAESMEELLFFAILKPGSIGACLAES